MTKSANNSTLELIKRLSLSIGITGYEGANNAHETIIAELDPLVDQVERDRMGSVIGLKLGEQQPAPDAVRPPDAGPP